MNVRHCRYCKKLFNHVMGPPICPLCKDEKEREFQKVKKFVQDNRGAAINVVAEECEVDIKQINQWIREERLQFADDSPIRVSCEKCGEMIRSGTFCEKCKSEMTNTLSNVYKKEIAPAPEPVKKSPDKDKMRFL
ncbi:MAG: flagellar protein [Lachnospiraceae bacterium]|nr:flagellar protein [Lachnospiraceae bacterium]